MIEERRIYDLQLFNNTQKTTDTTATTGNDLSPEMKTFYSDYLIDNAVPNLVYDQFAQKHPIPKNGGKTIEFRKYSPFEKALTPISEGVTPNGHKLNVEAITATVQQYGDYVELSDVLMLTAIDNNMVQATELLGNQAGETLNWVTCEVLNGGNNVVYAKGSADSRPSSRATLGTTNTLSVDDILVAVKKLKNANAKKIGDSYIGIVCPDIAYTLMRDQEWVNWHQYASPEELYQGEIGKIGGVRFIETTETKVWHGDNLAGTTRNLAVNNSDGYSTGATSIAFDGGTVAEDALIGRTIIIGNYAYEVTDNTSSAITLKSPGLLANVANDAVIYPGEGAAAGAKCYSTLILGANAFGLTEVAGGGLQHIAKQLGSSGSADPLNQRATVGWKAIRTAKILVDAFMVRIESQAK